MEEGTTRRLWWWGVGFGLYGIALLLERLGSLVRTTMPHISDYVSQGLPVPAAVDWQHPLSRALYWLSAHHDRWGALWWLLLAASPFIMFRALQPNRSFFQVTDSTDPSDKPFSLLHRRFDGWTVLRVLMLSLISLWLIGGWWWAYRVAELPLLRSLSATEERWLGGIYFWLPSLLQRTGPWLASLSQREEFISFFYFAACGLVLFVLWQGGVHPRRWLSAGGRGLAAGLLSASVLFLLFPPGHRVVRGVLQGVGSTGERLWHLWGIGFCVIGTLGFVALGVTVYLLARPGLAGRLRCFRISVAALIVIAALQAGLFTQVAQRRWDYGKEFRTAVLGERGRSRQREGRTLIIIGRRYGMGVSPLVTIVGEENNQRTKDRTWRYLRERNFRTCLSEVAFVHLHDCASLDWDPVASLEVDFTNITHCPSPVVSTNRGRRTTFVDLLLSKLSACPITPETRQYLDRLADERYFRHPSPVTRRVVGDLYWKFGDRKKAEEWFRKAQSSPRDIQRIKTDPLLVTNGVVQGTIVVNGQPAAGLRVGLATWGNRFELVGPQVPFAQRYIVTGTTTDAQGKFRLEHLPAGLYALVVAASSRVIPPNRNAIVVKNPPGIIDIGAKHPQRDVGRLEIEVNKDAPPAQEPSPPSPGERGTVVT